MPPPWAGGQDALAQNFTVSAADNDQFGAALGLPNFLVSSSHDVMKGQ